MKKISVAVLGLGFGGSFVPIYIDHPDVDTVGIYDTNEKLMDEFKKNYPSVKLYKSYEDMLADSEIDAIHILSPIPLHAEQTVKALESGKHCACTVPMATSLEDIERIVKTTRKSGKNYMMMETTLYTYQYFYVNEMKKNGELGKIQFLRGSHYQDMRNWPDYWLGLPPMWYGTHAIGPMVALSDSRIRKVHCFGSGTMDKSLHAQYGNPYPVESAIFEFDNGLKGEATRSLFETARVYQEGLFVYGSDACFEWGLRDRDDPYVMKMKLRSNGMRGSDVQATQVELPNYHQNLPVEIQKYTINAADFDPLNPQESLKVGRGGGHHGSHPHLVHEFVRSIIEKRKPWIDENLGANITAAGVCAHISAMNDGEAVIIPEF